MDKFYFGISKSDITPELGCLLYGYPRERHAEKISDRLSVGAAAMKKGDTTVLLMNTELCAFNVEACDVIRKTVSDAVGVDCDNIVYSVTHTHSGPVTHTSLGWGEADASYINDVLIPASVRAAKNALEAMVPAYMSVGRTECMAGINRRQVMDDGRVELGQNPDGPYDPTMVAISFKSEDGKNLGTIIHFACHPTVAGSNFSITRDWPGIMIDAVEEKTGAPCIYFNGAEGDVGPRLSNGATAANDSFVPEIGNIAAKSALEALENMSSYSTPDIKIHTEDILLPFAPAPSLEEINHAIEMMGDPEKLYATDYRVYDKYVKMREMIMNGEKIPDGVTHRQTVIAIDNLAIVPFCFEAFSMIAMNLRDNSPFDETIALGLSSGTRSYLPTEDQLPFGGYEVTMFRSAEILSYIDGLDKHLANECVRLLKKI